jgi:ERCC4-type nuclease
LNPRLQIQIVADYREAKSGVCSFLQDLDDVDLVIEPLPVGDYRIDERFLVERKTLTDFAVSLRDGRLLRQAYLLTTAPLHPILILEGTARDLATSRMHRAALQGALIHITLLLGIPLLRSKSSEETARLMCYLARQVDRIAYGALPRPRINKRPRGKRKLQRHLLQGLPGVGPARARRLLAKFGSIEAVLRADTDALQTVPGIGKETAARIRWLVTEPVPAYATQSKHQVQTLQIQHA